MSDILYINNQPIPKVDLNKNEYFLDKLCILYGTSGTGKSSLILHILGNLRNKIPIGICCNPTNAQNGDYAGVFPEECIYDDVSKPLLQRVFQRQVNAVAMYKLVRDPTQLRPLYKKISDIETQQKIDRLDSIYKRGMHDIKTKCDEEDADGAIAELTSKYHKKLVKIMRGSIETNMHQIKTKSSLTDIQRAIIENFNINPRILILIDDCAASIKEWKDLEETKKLFFQGRHMFVTTILTMQSESIIPPHLRSNAHISIFTTEKVTNTYLLKSTSGVSSEERKKISKIAGVIFQESEDADKPNYKKLVVFSPLIKTNYKIQYMIGNPKKRRFGSSILWELCDQVKREQPSSVSTASFSKMFAIKSNPLLEPIPH